VVEVCTVCIKNIQVVGCRKHKKVTVREHGDSNRRHLHINNLEEQKTAQQELILCNPVLKIIKAKSITTTRGEYDDDDCFYYL